LAESELGHIRLAQKTVNWKACIFWGVLIGLAVLAFIKRDIILLWISSIGTINLPDMSQFWQGMLNYVNQNPIAVIGTAASLCTAGVAIISKIRATKQKAEALEQKAQTEDVATQQVLAAQQQALDYKQKYEDLAKSNATNSFQDSLNEAQTIISQQNDQIKNLQGQMQGLQTQLLLEKTKVVEKTVVK
jgi:hypothetical protein